MIGGTRQVAVWAYGRPVDMRKSFDGLWAVVRDELGRDPMSGDLFLFTGRNRRRAKVLLWDGTGVCIYAKRLEQGRFTNLCAETPEGTPLRMTVAELQLFLEGTRLEGRLPLSPAQYSHQQYSVALSTMAD